MSYDGIDLQEGSLEFPQRITAGNEEARAWFARGWFHAINYNHEEAISCFARSVEADGTCLMAYWGTGEGSLLALVFCHSIRPL